MNTVNDILSKKDEALLFAYNKGYRIHENGDILNPNKVKLRGTLHSNGYKRISIRIDGESRDFTAHRLAAYQKYGDSIFDNKIQVRHLDDNPVNNALANIAIGSASDNQMDKPKEVRVSAATKASKKANPRTPIQRIQIYIDKLSGMSYKEIGLKNNVSKGTLSFMFNKSEEFNNFVNFVNSIE